MNANEKNNNNTKMKKKNYDFQLFESKMKKNYINDNKASANKRK